MTSSSSKPPPRLLHVDTTAITTTNGSGSSSSSPVAVGSSSRSSPRPSPGGGSGSGQNQACAACKYQRRKCNPDCPLARYFPADQQRRFLNAHRLFGVSNIQKTLRRIEPEYGPEAMRSLIYQSEARAVDPVYGCVRIINQLEHEISVGTAELSALRHQIAIYRQAAANAGVVGVGDNHQLDANPSTTILAAPGQEQDNNNVPSGIILYGAGADQAGAAGFVVVHDDQQQQHFNNDHQQAQLYDYFCYDGTAGDEATSHDASTVQADYCYSDASVVKAGSPLASSLGQQMENHCQIEAAAPFVDAFDVKPHHQDLPVTMAGVQQPQETKDVATAMVSYDHADHNMAAPATAQCHLELGFSSF